MKPSPYFKDQFRYFFKRFVSEDSLFRWFLNKACTETGAFDFPKILESHPRTLVVLPRDMESSTVFMHRLPPAFFQNVLFLAHESLHSLISAKRTHAIYFSDKECRYGESVFDELAKKITDFSPEVCIYLGEANLPRLYLVKRSGASLRIGFNCEKLYPFLNLSLSPETSDEALLIAKYYGVAR